VERLRSVKGGCVSFERKPKQQARSKRVGCLRLELSVQIRKVYAAYNSGWMGAFLSEWGAVDLLYSIKIFNGAGGIFSAESKIAQARA
jgi:hypothetical protein